MLVLGLIDSKPSSVAVLDDGVILSAVAEERLCRMKMASGMPRQAIAEALRVAGVSARDLDAVAVAQRISVFEPEPIPWKGWFHTETGNRTSGFDRLSSTLAPIVGRVPAAWKAHHLIKGFVYRDRVRKLPEVLRRDFGVEAPVAFYDHHHCHATTAYYTSGFDDTLVITLDGGGDGQSGSVYVGRNGRLERLAGVDSFNSLGNFYSYITALCGFKAELHEGKITGLAACGEPVYVDVLRQFVRYQEPGKIRYTIPMYHGSALRLLSDRLPTNFDRGALAASVQLLLEEIGTAFVRYWLRRTGMRKLAVAGGVFANVKLNQRVHELEEVDRFFVHPAMDDGGLSVGGALATLSGSPHADPRNLIRRLDNVYLGPGDGESGISTAAASSGFEVRQEPEIHDRIARLLSDGYVVARLFGRMEYGPRALGHRSILYATTDPSVNDWLNESLRRTEFMPFAPATLADKAGECFEGISGAEDPARFMTITFDCTETMKAKSPGVVHVDGTARPQLVDAGTSPDLHGILTAYYRRTGIPSIINTSFNIHEEPIVCTPDDAVRAFREGNLDYLAMGDWLIANPNRDEMRKERSAKVS